MKIAGRIDAVGLTPTVVAADTKRVARFNLPQAANVSKGSMYLDGLGGGGGGPQVCRMVVYDVADNLVAQSDEVSVAQGQSAGWVDFAFSAYRGKLALAAGDFFAGLHAGPFSNTIRMYVSPAAHGMGSKSNADTYSDGPSAAFGAATAVTTDFACYLAYFTPYASLQPAESDLYYSRLPLPEAQSILGVGGPQVGTRRLVSVGWHDTFIDPEMGSAALVRDGSDLVDLFLGERVRVTRQQVTKPRTVVAYVHNVADANAFDWDLSLSRRLYAQIALLANETVPVIAEVIA